VRLIVDTNRIIAALIKDGASRTILLSDHTFMTLSFSHDEMARHTPELLAKSHLTEHEFKILTKRLMQRIAILDDEVIRNKLKEAKRVMDPIDPADTPFIAAALSVPYEGIWTDDKHFLRQARVRVWTTDVLMKIPEE
jgi:predicted nucleic acid-binding protein